MLVYKLIYFALNLVIYSTHTFSFKFFQDQLELDVWWVGVIAAVSSMQFLGAIFWGWLADRRPQHRRALLTMACILYDMAFAILNLPVTSKFGVAGRVGWGAGWFAASIFASAALFPLVDAHVIKRVKSDGFGSVRVWGTVGHALATLISGITIDYFGYIGMFANMGVSSIIFILAVMMGLEDDSKLDTVEDDKIKEKEQGQMQPKSSRLWTATFTFLMLFIFACGFQRSILSIFLPLYMQNEMGKSAILVAAVTVVRTLSESAIFLLNPRLHALMGTTGLLALSLLTGVMRMASYAVLPTRGSWFYASFGIELLKGISTASVVSGGVVAAEREAAKGRRNSAQACFSGIYNGLAGTMGGLTGALLLYYLPNHSMPVMFAIVAGIGTCMFVLFFAAYMIALKMKNIK